MVDMSIWTTFSYLPSSKILHIVCLSHMTSLVSGLVISPSNFWHTLSTSRWFSGLSSLPTSFQSSTLLHTSFYARPHFPSTIPPRLDEWMARHLNRDGQQPMLWPTAQRRWVRDLGVIRWMIILVITTGEKCHQCVSWLQYVCTRGYWYWWCF